MTPAKIIRGAKSDGVVLALSPTGTLKATGDDNAVRRWLGVIREHKSQLIDALQVGAGDTAIEAGTGEPLPGSSMVAFDPLAGHKAKRLCADDEQSIRSWLEHIGETDAAVFDDVVQRCQQDSEARAYFTKRAAEELPKPAPYPDDRRTCSQCKNLSGKVCTIACPGGVVSAVKGYTPNRTTLIRCAGFAPKGL